MAVLDTIRTKFGVFASIIIALGLLGFIVSPDDLVRAFNNMSSKNDVGKINGNTISYTDFQEEVNRFTTINDLTGGDRGADQQDQLREAAWQNMVYRYLFNERAKDAGLTVGAEELKSLMNGGSPVIAQNTMFFDENGEFSQAQVANFAQASKTDENVNLYWNYLQNTVFQQQLIQKYANLFSASDVKNPVMLRRDIEENNNTFDVDFVMVPMSFATDSTIVVSDKEIRDYYNNHQNFFKQQASRDIEYVVFEVIPSAEDIEATRQSVADLYEDFAAADNMRNFLLRNNSDRAFSEYWYKKGELNNIVPAIEEFVWESNEPVSDIITSEKTFYLAKVVDTKNLPDSVYVRHMLFQGTNADHLADSLLTVLQSKKETFSNLAALYSDDQGSIDEGELGNLGWLTQSYMIPGLESVITAETGKPYILKSQYGTHIVEVTRKTSPIVKKQVAIFEKETLPSKETFNSYYSQANNFATAAAGKYENYRRAVDTLGVYSHPLTGMLESSNSLGAISNTREVTRWAFDNKPGKVSNIMTIDNNYFIIATVRAAHEEGVAKVSEVASQIRSQLYSEKASKKQAEEVAEKIAGLTSLEAIAEALNTSVSSQSGIAFSSMGAQALDPSFLGALTVAPEGKVCGPIAGAIGTYIFQVKGHDTGAYYTEDDARMRDAQNAAYYSQMIVPVMMDDTGVKDNRARFF
ncbi:MAG: SurA N-terminal domain-containing protein [Bacteroidales bacterium]|nr:SurA N-terminal domain-containing protein [Bacteroidales bacterium]